MYRAHAALGGGIKFLDRLAAASRSVILSYILDTHVHANDQGHAFQRSAALSGCSIEMPRDEGINLSLDHWRGAEEEAKKWSKDVELVFKWAKNRTLVEARGAPVRIGAHGISMGGIAAAHLGKRGLVDFLFLDRTFCDLAAIPAKWHWCLPPLMRFFTWWSNPPNAENYSLANCYKVIAQDPNDEIVPDSCSAKTGVAR